MTFDIVPAARAAALMPQLRAISSRWLKDKATAEKGFSVGAFSEMYLRHFFAGLRQYKEKFAPVWESRYLVARGGLRLPQTLLDVSTLISGGTRELFLK